MKSVAAHGIAQEILFKRASLADIENLAAWVEKIAPALDELLRNARRNENEYEDIKWHFIAWDLNYLLNLLERQSEIK